MELSKEEIQTITEALVKASNSSGTEWLSIEKTILDNYSHGQNENTDSIIREMWKRLHLKVEEAMKRMN